MKRYSHGKVFKGILRLYVKISPFSFFISLLLTFLSGLLPALMVILWNILFTAAYSLGEGGVWDVFSILAALAGAHLLTLLFERAYIWNETYTVQRVKINLLSEIHRISAIVPVERFEESDYFHQVYRASQIVNGRKFDNTIRHILQMLRGAVTVVSIVSVLWIYSPWLVLLAFASVLPALVARILRGENFYYFTHAQTPQKRVAEYTASLLTSPPAIREARIFGSREYVYNKWSATRDALNKEEWAFSRRNGIIQTVVDTTRVAGYITGLYCTFALIAQGQIAVGMFGAAAIAFQSTQDGFSTVLLRISNFISGLNDVCDLVMFADTKPEVRGTEKLEQIQSIEFKNVSFTYPQAETPALKNVSFTLKQNETIALVGENGAGKSTLVKLMLGLYKPTSGEILYNGLPQNRYPEAEIYRHFSAVFQDYVPYHFSYRENIAMSNIAEQHNSEKLNEVAAAYNLGDIVGKLKEGLDTEMGTAFGGADLSGGEWQRTAVARCGFKEAEFLVLDEPTASLDPKIEAEIFNRFMRHMEGRTAVVVTHRIGSARMAERIILLENGEITETGTHGALLAKNGAYAELYRLQAKWYAP